MATYYIPPRLHSQSDASYRSSSTSAAAASPQEQADDLQLDQSIYIFPTPSSTPASPSGSSAFSAPTDFPDTLSSTGTRSRDQSFSSSGPARSRGAYRLRGRESASATRTQSRARSAETDEYDLEVEYWDWTAESGEDVPDDEGVWEFEAEMERASRWDFPTHLARRLSPLRTLNTTNTGLNADFYEQNYRIFLRARTQSNTSSLATSSSLSSKPTVPTPHPRIHIPLLSFFASLLSLDLDEPALRLLTHSSADCVLFPGQRNLLCEGTDLTCASPPDDKDEVSKPRWMMRLRRIDDRSRPPDGVIKDGLAAACDTSVLSSPFSLPGLSALAGLYRFVGGVWSNAGRAWQEAQSDPQSLPMS